MRACALLSLAAAAAAENIVVVGDSWADYIGIPNREFPAVFERHGDTRTIKNIAIAGTTCKQWSQGTRLQSLVDAVKGSDVEHVWMICGGNDAQFELIGCRPQDECIAKLIEEAKHDVSIILNAVHEANPKVRVAGFGYDLMGWSSIIGQVLVRSILPDCSGEAACSNADFTKLQMIYDETAEKFSFFDSVNLLGSLQASQGVEGASVGHPVLSQFSPSNMYDITTIHPTAEGYRTIFENFYELYWSKNRKSNSTAA